MINTRYDNLDFGIKTLSSNTLSYEESSLSFKDVFNTVQNDINYNEKKEDISVKRERDDYSKDSSMEEKKEVFETFNNEEDYKDVEDSSEDKIKNYSENNDIDDKSVEEKNEEKKNKLKANSNETKDAAFISDEEKIIFLKNKNKTENTDSIKNLLNNIDIKKLSEDTDFLKEKIKNIKQNLKKEDEEEIKNILASLVNLKSILQEIKSEGSVSKTEKLYISKNNSKEDISEKKSLEDIKKLISDISQKMKKLDDSVSSELKEIKEAFASVMEKDVKFDNIDKNETRQSKSKVESDGRAESAFFKDASLSKDDTTEITIVKMKDDSYTLGDKLNSSFNETGKSQNASKTDTAETISKFQDMLSKLVDKAKIGLSEGRSEVVMTLKPEHLGDVRLKLIMEGDKLNAKIFVDNAEIKDIFTKNLDTVISSLNEIDINIEGFDVMLRGDNPENQNNDNDFNMFQRNENIKNGVEGFDVIKENDNVVIDRYTLEQKKLNILI